MVYKHFKCPHCQAISTAGLWNETTIKHCINRYQRRVYTKIQNAGSGNKWYECPHCHKRCQLSAIKGVQKNETKEEPYANDTQQGQTEEEQHLQQ